MAGRSYPAQRRAAQSEWRRSRPAHATSRSLQSCRSPARSRSGFSIHPVANPAGWCWFCVWRPWLVTILLQIARARFPGSFFHRHDEVAHDVIFSFRRILAHVKGQDARRVRLGGIFHLGKPHFLADKLLEFRRRDFAKPLEPRDLAALAKFGGGLVALGLRVTIDGFLLVAHPEERRLEHVQVPIMNELI